MGGEGEDMAVEDWEGGGMRKGIAAGGDAEAERWEVGELSGREEEEECSERVQARRMQVKATGKRREEERSDTGTDADREEQASGGRGLSVPNLSHGQHRREVRYNNYHRDETRQD